MFARAVDRISSEQLTTAAIVAGFVLAATLGGLVIAWGKPAVVAIAVGALASVFLFNFPAFVVWVVLIGTLVISGPLVFFVRAAGPVPWAFALLGVFLLFASVMHAGLQKEGRERGPVPGFIVIGFVLVVYSLATMAWSNGPMAEGLAGAKRYFQYFGLMFAIALIHFREQTIRRWVMFVVVVAFLCVPMAIYQRIFLATTLRGGMDSIVGLLELSEQGMGASGVMAWLCVVMLCGLAAAWRERLISGPRLIVLGFIVMVPVLIGEVNVIFIWLPLSLGVLFFDQVRARPLAFVGGAAGIVVAMVMFASIYALWQQAIRAPGNNTSAEQQIRHVIEYNFGEEGYFGGGASLNRKTVYTYWAKHHGLANPVQTVLGHGLGSALVNGEQVASVARRHKGLNIGLVGASLLLWEVGIVGLLLYVSMLGLAALHAFRLTRTLPQGRDRALARTLLVSSTLLISVLAYNDTMLMFPSMQVFAAGTLGLIAWLARRESARTRTVPGVRPFRPAQAAHA